MKNWSRIGIVFALVLTLVIAAVPAKVAAKQIIRPEIAPGSWTWTANTSGSEVQPETLTAPAPTWRLLITNGLVLSGPATLCHEFSGNQIGWMGDIYRLDGDSWTKLVTTVDWVPTTEGKLMACAQAPAAGTYTLFAYWEKPEGWQPSCRLVFKASFTTCNLGKDYYCYCP